MDRVLKGTGAVARLTTFLGGDPAAPDSPPNVTVYGADGSELRSGTATIDATTGVSEFTLTTTDTAELNVLRLVWDATVDATTQQFETFVEIVGGFLVSLAELRQVDPLEDETAYPDDRIQRARILVESSLEDACKVAFVPRYGRATLDGNGGTDLLLPKPGVLAIRSVSIDGAALTADELADVQVYEDEGLAYYPNGWTRGRRNVVLEFEHGYRFPPGRVPEATKQLVRHVLVESPVDDRALSVTNEDGTVQVFVQPGIRGAVFAIPEANAVVQQYGMAGVA